MTSETNKALTRHFMERAFNEGDLTIVDEALVPDGIDHQEPLGTNFARHLKEVITMLRTAFPDLHFEIHEMLAEGELVAFRSTMTGTHRGPFQGLSPTSKQISD
jgi:predicted ester cyclase